MTRWLLLSLGLATTALAFYALVDAGSGEKPLDDIDAASRARLESVLQKTEGQ